MAWSLQRSINCARIYDVNARVSDMNINGIAASLNFGSFVAFDGSLIQVRRPLL
jgi:hypothetical protein